MTMKSRNLMRFVLIVALGGSEACSSRAAYQPGPFPQAESRTSEPRPQALQPSETFGAGCSLIAGQSEQNQTISVVALNERVDPANAPHPTNESERLLFRQLYESLLRVDCEGRLGPGLASTWQLDSARGVWVLTLRPNSQYSNGTPVTAADVVESWSRNGTLLPEVRRLVRSAEAVDGNTLEIALLNPGEGALKALAHTDLAVAKSIAESPWRLGTRQAVIDTAALASASQNEIHLTYLSSPGDSPDVGQVSIRFLMAPGRDPRDLLDEGVDLLLTRDSTALDYAAALPQFGELPLPWQRTYVLLAPGRYDGVRELSFEERDTLAHDAIRGESRGSAGPFWWQSLSCDSGTVAPAAVPPGANGRIVYDGNDSVARDLAERLVGLVRASNPGSPSILDALVPGRALQRATGLTGSALATTLSRGTDAAYILALDSDPLDPCRDLQILTERVGWADAKAIVPLADTRLQAIVRRGRSGAVREWDGGLLLRTEIANP